MPMVAQQAPYTLFIVDDDYAESPRGEHRDNFGKMVCWHSRHNLGDEHDYSEPEDFLIDLCNNTVPKSEIVQMILDNKFENLRFEPHEDDKNAYHIKSYCEIFKKWYTEAAYEAAPMDIKDTIVDVALPFLKNSELLDTLNDYSVILPLYLYDHSGITMNTSGFSCPWDSGQVGWIYADYNMIKKEYGEVTPETLERAKALLESEVEEYDYYLTGQCYGYKLYEGDAEIDSCWGFLGSISDVSKHIKEHLPIECENIVDSLVFHSDIDEDEYLEQALDAEDDLER